MKLIIPLFAYLLICLCFFSPLVLAQGTVRSDNFEITWPNLNMGAGLPASSDYQIGVTTGQTAPGLYSSTGFKVRAGFQYIHSIIPFSFKISSLALTFGTLTPQSLDNNQFLTFIVNSGSAGGYQVTSQESSPLTSATRAIIPDTTCDPSDPCTHINAGTWVQPTTYGFGYNMTGLDVPSEFLGGKYKNFADYPEENPVKIMGKTIAEGHEAGRNKVATMSARINISNSQPPGTYLNILTFVAIPTF